MTALDDTAAPSFGPLTILGLLLVTGCTVATLATAAVEAKHARAETTAPPWYGSARPAPHCAAPPPCAPARCWPCSARSPWSWPNWRRLPLAR
ncbi:hypothetical protein SALBM311S_06876 [Streptomyces alboniger]